jgi:ubiquinone/menaquinone biosynthesis C-methylase UbiE
MEKLIMKNKISRSLNYDSIADVYDQRYTRSEYGPVLELLLKFVDTSSNRILEVGCGTGYWLNELGKHKHSVNGVDPSIEMLQMARQKQSGANLIQGLAEALPWHNASFDRLFCINSFHHFTNQKGFIEEVRRVIRPGGGILIIGLDPHTCLDRWWIYDYFPQVIDIDRQRYPPTRAIRELLASNGFSDCVTTEALHWPVEFEARSALKDNRLAKTTTSQLTVLTDSEYEIGIKQLIRDIQASEALGKVLKISADLRLFATIAWLR